MKESEIIKAITGAIRRPESRPIRPVLASACVHIIRQRDRIARRDALIAELEQEIERLQIELSGYREDQYRLARGLYHHN